MMLKKDEVIKIAEEILCMLEVNGYNLEQMSSEEVGKLVDQYLDNLYDDFIENCDNLFEDEDISYENFEMFYDDFTYKVKSKRLHMNNYLN